MLNIRSVPEEPRAGESPVRRGPRRGIALLLVLAAWLAVAGVGGPLVGRLSEVQRNDNASFLPETAEATEVNALTEAFTETESLPFFVVVERREGLTPQDREAVAGWAAAVPGLEVPVAGQDPLPVGDLLAGDRLAAVPSQDGQAAFVPVPLDADAAARNLPDGESAVFGVAEALRGSVEEDLRPTGLEAHVAGPAGVLADFSTAFAGIDGRLLQVTLAVVFVILLLVYRSPLLPFAALLSALFALSAAGAVIFPLAERGTIDLNGQSQGILFILVVGAATDYALLLVARYREELHAHDSRFTAMAVAWRASLEPIAASAATVIFGLLCLLLADLGSTRGLGPVGATGIAAAALSVLTFLPVLLLAPVILLGLLVVSLAAAAGALLAGPGGAAAAAAAAVAALVVLAVLRHRALRSPGRAARQPWYARPPAGRWLFWPRVPHADRVAPVTAAGPGAEAAVRQRGLWGRVAALVGRRPRAVWVATLAALLALAAFVPQFEADGIRQTDVFRDRVESVVGGEVLAEHFPAGSGSPVLVIAPAEDLDRVLEVTTAADEVVAAVPTGAAPPAPGGPPGEPTVVDGRVQVEATLEPAADSLAGERAVEALRVALDEVGADVLVGGQTAANLDVRQASERDLRVVVPAVLAVILAVLVLLLRSVVAPVLLVVANVVSYGATIGAAAIVFGDRFLDLPGGDPAVPLYAFVFLVALGIDYSIFLMTRVREETLRRGTRPGILTGLAVTGGVITSAGIVLAATFSALVTIPLVFMLQIAFLVAFGVLLDTFVVRTLLVPAAAYDIGPRVWWPHALSRHAGARAEGGAGRVRQRRAGDPRAPVG